MKRKCITCIKVASFAKTSLYALHGRCPSCGVTPGSLPAARSGIFSGLHSVGPVPSSPVSPVPGACAPSPSQGRKPLQGLNLGKPS